MDSTDDNVAPEQPRTEAISAPATIGGGTVPPAPRRKWGGWIAVGVLAIAAVVAITSLATSRAALQEDLDSTTRDLTQARKSLSVTNDQLDDERDTNSDLRTELSDQGKAIDVCRSALRSGRKTWNTMIRSLNAIFSGSSGEAVRLADESERYRKRTNKLLRTCERMADVDLGGTLV